MRNNYWFALFQAAGFTLAVTWLPVLAAEGPGKEAVVQVKPQTVKKQVQVTPVKEQLRHRQRAVTSDDYKPLAGSTPGVRVHRVTQPRPSSGGADAESPAPTAGTPPSSLRDKNRKSKKESPVDN